MASLKHYIALIRTNTVDVIEHDVYRAD